MTALSLALVALTVQTADTIAPAVAVESPYTIKSGALELGATLAVPRDAKGRIPIAVIIAGSGPTDRNGNSMMGIRPNSYAQLAWRLAERGIATLRMTSECSRARRVRSTSPASRWTISRLTHGLQPNRWRAMGGFPQSCCWATAKGQRSL